MSLPFSLRSILKPPLTTVEAVDSLSKSHRVLMVASVTLFERRLWRSRLRHDALRAS